MANCHLNGGSRERARWMQEIECWVDGESAHPEQVAQHVAGCATCKAYEDRLRALHSGVAAATQSATISDAQLGVFLAGMRERRARSSWWRSSWKVLSVSMATLLVLLAGSVYTYAYLNVPDPPVVESASTDIEDGAVTTYASDNGVTTVWVVSQDDDVW